MQPVWLQKYLILNNILGGRIMKTNRPIFVTKPSIPPMDEYVNEIQELWDTHILTNMGVKHKQFQHNLREFLDVGNVELLVNGHMALELTLQAMNLTGEVITTPFTFASTTHTIVRNGLTPVFCDIDAENYTIDVNLIENLITEKTTAILPVHVYGNICDVERIDEIGKKYGLKVIYDAAHAFAEKINGVSVGNFGDASIFSFHATKVFNSIEGGCVAYKDDSLGNRLLFLKNFGIHGPESVVDIGTNAKMNEFCAAMGICNLRHISDEIGKRKSVYERYLNNLNGTVGLKLKAIQNGVLSNYSYFPIVVEDSFGASRDDIYNTLLTEGITARKYFYPLTSAFECYHDKFDSTYTPIALDISERVLTLPLFADMTMDDVDMICEIVYGSRK